jgi:hypothetical protein
VALHRLGRPPEAEAELQGALAMRVRLLDPDWSLFLAHNALELAELETVLQRRDKACAYIAQAAAIRARHAQASAELDAALKKAASCLARRAGASIASGSCRGGPSSASAVNTPGHN